ncbi:MAG TPA: hypothetical protein VKG24_24615 [Pseudolabrys sp.]|jgi:hypothetical protein|nr:hypothetical protein [Pseudolabrys sp.]
MSKIKLLITAVTLCGGLTASAVSAMPIAPIPANTATSVEQVRWVCGSYGRCWWRPNYYGGYHAYAYYPRHRYWHHHHHRHYYSY